MSNIRTLTQTPGVWLDCQVEDDRGGARVSWDAATGIIADEPLAAAFSRFEHAVRRHAGQVDEVVTTSLANWAGSPQPGDSEWASAVIAAATGLCEAEQVRPEYAALVRRWQQLGTTPHAPAAGYDIGDTARAARRLADIVIGAASPQTLVGDPQLAPEAMLLADERLQWVLDDLSEHIFGHSQKVRRRLRVMEIGSRTGLITQRLTAMIGAVVDEYLCFEPNPVLAEIAAGRDVKTATRQISSPEQLAAHQCGRRGLLRVTAPASRRGGGARCAQCGRRRLAVGRRDLRGHLGDAGQRGRSQPRPAIARVGSWRAADQWWRFIAQHRWQPAQMTQDGPGLTIIAHRQQSFTPPQSAPRANTGPPSSTPRPSGLRRRVGAGGDRRDLATAPEHSRRPTRRNRRFLPARR